MIRAASSGNLPTTRTTEGLSLLRLLLQINGVVAWGTGDNENQIVLRLLVKDEMANGAVLDFIYLYPPY